MRWKITKLDVITSIVTILTLAVLFDIYAYKNGISRVAMRVTVLYQEIDYARDYYHKNKSISSSKEGIFEEVHVHDFSKNFSIDGVFRREKIIYGRSFIFNNSLIVIVDSPAHYSWFIYDISGNKPGICKEFIGSSEGNLSMNNICRKRGLE
jgi:hypothetical protein